MARITVIGGTGYAGSHIVAEAAGRGHDVVSFSRNAPAAPTAGVDYRHGDATDTDALRTAVDGADIVIGALSPRGELAGRILAAYQRVAELAKHADERLIIVGGWSALRPEPGAPRFSEGEIPEQFRAEALEMVGVLEWLQSGASGTDYVFVSPAATFGAYAPGKRTGSYRTSGEVALTGPGGEGSSISGADFAIAIVDEAERGAHHREHVSFAN